MKSNIPSPTTGYKTAPSEEKVKGKKKCKHEYRQLITINLLQPTYGGGGIIERYYCIKCLKKI